MDRFFLKEETSKNGLKSWPKMAHLHLVFCCEELMLVYAFIG